MEELQKIQGLIIQPFYENCLFEGEIVCQENGSFDGRLSDTWGESRIVGMINESAGEMDFRKKYNHRQDLIFYSFKKQGSLWLGSYTGVDTGPGGAQCEIYEVFPKLDWETRLLTEKVNRAHIEEQCKYLMQKMIKDGYLEVVGKDEDGEDLLRPTDKGKSLPDPDINLN